MSDKMKTLLSVVACMLVFVCSPLIVEASAIHDVVTSGNLVKVKSLLKKYPAQINARDEDDNTPLHLAVINERFEIAKYLLDKGASATAVDAESMTPLQKASFLHMNKMARLIIEKTGKSDIYTAIMIGDIGLVKSHLDANPKLVNKPDTNGDPPLWHASDLGFSDVAELLIERGADVNLASSMNGTPLQRAVGGNYIDAAKLLFKHGATFGKDVGGQGLLESTMYPGREKMAQLLISNGAKSSILYATYAKDIDTVRKLLDAEPRLIKGKDNDSTTPLHVAAERDAVDIAELLVSRGADVNACRYEDETPLSRAAAVGSMGVAKLLIAKGAKVNSPIHTDSPLYCAAKNGYTELAKLLIDHGADVSSIDVFQSTPLHVAASAVIARLLVESGAKVDVKNIDGCTPLHIACKDGRVDVIKFLISKGAKVNAKDNEGATPLGWAAGKGHKDVVELLKKYKAKKVLPSKDALQDGGRCEPIYLDPGPPPEGEFEE